MANNLLALQVQQPDIAGSYMRGLEARAQRNQIRESEETKPYRNRLRELDLQSKEQGIEQTNQQIDMGKLEMASARNQQIGQIIASAKANPGSYAQLRQQAITQFGADPASIPEQYDPAFLSQMEQQVIGVQGQLDNLIRQQQLSLQAELGRGNLGVARGNLALRGQELALSQQERSDRTALLKQEKEDKEAERQAALAVEENKAAIAQEGTKASAEIVHDTIANAKAAAGSFETGRFGVVSRATGSPKAAELDGYINTLQANLSFDRLQQMRDQSKTGGALGAVSERELTLLGSTVAALDPNAGEKVLKQQLQIVDDHYTRWEIAQTAQTIDEYNARTKSAFLDVKPDRRPPEAAREYLLANPELASDFDKKYGKGMADRVFGE